MSRRNSRFAALALATSGVSLGVLWSPVTYAQTGPIQPVLLRDSFPIGDASGILCQVQDRSVENPAKMSMFDRAWAVVCRDSAQPVGEVYSFRTPVADDPYETTAQQRRTDVDCAGSEVRRSNELPGLEIRTCKVSGTQLGWSIFSAETGNARLIAEGFTAYDDATLLALRSVVNNRIAAGTIDAASTSVADPLSFARVQAETLKPEQALAEGYRRNLGGEYAEASAYFETLQQRLAAQAQPEDEDPINPGEFFVNRALQKSNLGEFGEANRLFEQAEPLTAGDPVAGRLQRNFEAIHLLNQGFYPEAIERLERRLDAATLGAAETDDKLSITLALSTRINQTNEADGLLGVVDELKLTRQERSEIIDAQALQLRGTALRVEGRLDDARGSLIEAYGRAIAVRDGRVISITRLRAQVLGELAIIAERQGQAGDAETYLRNGLAILEVQYPERRAVSGAQARLASFLLRQGRQDEAVTLYRGVIDRAAGKRNAVTGFANQLNPYYRLLASQVDGSDRAAQDFFKASQVLIRPGVAETQAILARELSANSTEGARLFRQAIDLGRDIERLRRRYESLSGVDQTPSIAQERSELAAQIERFEQDQLITQAQLSVYPQYRVVAPRTINLDEFRQSLNPGEAYARLALVGGDVFMFYTDSSTARAYRVDLSEEDLDFHVDMLRASISLLEAGRYVTYPYEVGMARELYRALFDPIAAELASVDHLIFEPDGALLRLPIDILVADDESVARYQERTVLPGGDVFDFTGINWLGRERRVSTAVSAQSFVDARKVGRSRASQQYLGLGQNVPIGSSPPPQVRAVIANGSDNCGWNAGLWNNPIDDAELVTARNLIGRQSSELITGAAFTDTHIKSKDNLQDFRVLHFATHGLVTPPNPRCQAKPALLTSFGEGESDGLLTFEEIFELDLDADIVILSACDTAGEASIEATRSAGIASGGGTALDGLVRSFIGAGGRAVMASHWPAPDDFQATERLMSEMFRLGRTESIGGALRGSQRALMDNPDTSHPYYWGGFAIIGDAERPLLSDRTAVAAVPEGSKTMAVIGQ
ncbi:CHAT domain-containing protein [Pontixanthobacter aestiaquae]|uniref:CHAT domain-containing protein n=1 Tax=Pontixanthobacter aestiaquae TaxID=1509367 RepID=A0A844ZAH4_9SPHN|nr:CHAT domain-containing protein [Pontixanthobacter aestiaquae]MDN3644926.1 CHAT domain-containing protein [Pontixanthobacter aestiaquae]MXO84073.1 CHAT domain-containing protein [Pontixanthobacter aestiaquae]